MFKAFIKITGDKKIINKLKELPKKLNTKIVRKGLRAGAKVIHAECVALAPMGLTGALKKGIKVRSAKRKKNRIGVLVELSSKTMKGDSFYAPFVEKGTSFGKGNAATMPEKWKQPRIKARLFLKQASNNKRKAASGIAMKVMSEEIKIHMTAA